MSAGKGYKLETLNPLSDEFYRRYGLFHLSADDTVVFGPTIWAQGLEDVQKIEPKKAQKLASKPNAGNAIFRKKLSPSVLTNSVGFPLKKPKAVEEGEPAKPEIQRERSSGFLAIFVRLLLIGHNVLTVWRVTATYNNELYWLLLLADILMVAEGLFTVIRRSGVDYKWWCPCFLIYLASTLPAIWLLQLKQYELATQNGASVSGRITPSATTMTTMATDTISTVTDTTSTLTETTTALITSVTSAIENSTTSFVDNVTDIANITAILFENTTSFITTSANNNASINVSLADATTASTQSVTQNVTSTNSTVTVPVNATDTNITRGSIIGDLSPPDADIWLIIINESLVYLLVFSRWLLPRRDMSREFLADLLLEFLAIASDIMELLAVFDESEVRENLLLNYWVMAVWSASFIQFIPVLAQKRMFRHLRAPQRKLFTKFCGTSFVEIAYTCMSIFLQDGPFLVLRLYIMVSLNLITYSLVFFVLKNAVTVILLVYRLGIICYRLPCCRSGKPKGETVDVENAIDCENVTVEDIDEDGVFDILDDDNSVSVDDIEDEPREKAL